jgi:F0F1-type ATP synthase membrane subunit a
VIGGLLSHFADSGPEVHVAPSAVFHVGGITITNSVLYGWIAIVFIVAVAIAVARRITVHPKGGFIQYVELVVEFIRGTVEGAFEDKAVAVRYVPYFVSVFILFLFVNWLGLLPFTGDAFLSHDQPLLRPFTGDLIATLFLRCVRPAAFSSICATFSSAALKIRCISPSACWK